MIIFKIYILYLFLIEVIKIFSLPIDHIESNFFNINDLEFEFIF